MKPWEKNIRVVDPYVPGEQPVGNIIKLNTNENPYPPAPAVREAVKEIDSEKFRLYPEVTSKVLVDALGEYYQLQKDQIFVGVGSDDVLAMAFMAFFNSDKPILFPDITYSFYDVWCNLFRIPFERPALDTDFRIVKEDYYRENGGVVIANPNAPTSICEGLDFIEDILQHNQDVVVIVDEAYIDFGGESAISLIPKSENLIVVQTFSKSRSMAGMRIGYAMGNAALIKALHDVKYSYNSYTMNQTALQYGVAAVKDVGYFKEIIGRIVSTREKVAEQLRALGFSFPESKANFLFVTHEKVSAKELYEGMRKDGIYVRYFNLPRIDNYLRITIGTEEEMRQMIDWVSKYLGSYGKEG